MTSLGKSLIILGAVIAAVGCLLTLSEKFPWLGKLPGDITINKQGFSFHFPITTCIIISIVISLLLHLLRR